MSDFVLGLDGGGTKTHVICADTAGSVVGEGISGPASLTAVTPGAASFNVNEAIRQATSNLPGDHNLAVLVAGIAGLDAPSEEAVAKQVLSSVLTPWNLGQFHICNDSLIALENGTEKADALVLISGTGSNCYGRNAAGEVAKTGGMDYILTDQGSGYAIGRSTLRVAVKSFDGRIARTMLEQFVCEHFSIKTLAELKPKVHQPLLSKSEIAELVQVCVRAADSGDVQAQAILLHATEELSLMATTVLHRLKLTAAAPDCVLAGSITKLATVQTGISEAIKAVAPQAQIVIPTQAPAHGAVKMALKMLQTPS